MDCLLNFVGLKYDGAPVPPSGVYINSQPGITTDMLDRISEREQKTWSGVWDDVQRSAGSRFYSYVVAALMKKYTLKQIREQVKISVEPKAYTVRPTDASTGRGLMIAFERTGATFEALSLSEVTILSTSARSATIRVLNASGVVLFEKEANLQAGQNSVPVNKVLADDTLFIGLHGADFTTYQTKIPQAQASCFRQSVCSCHNTCYPKITGARIVGNSIIEDPYTHGIGFVGHLVCDYAALVCRNKAVFLGPWLNLLSNQVMVELLASSKVVQETTVNREQYVELKDHYAIEYEKSLQTLIDGVCLDQSCCVVSSPPLKRKVWGPFQ